MKVLFVNPPQTASKYKFMGVIAPPLGIAYMAGVLQENNVDVEILDASAEDMDFTVDKMFISMTLYDFDNVGEIAIPEEAKNAPEMNLGV